MNITKTHQDSLEMPSCAMHRWRPIPLIIPSSKSLGKPTSLHYFVWVNLSNIDHESLKWNPGINPYLMRDLHMPKVGSFF